MKKSKKGSSITVGLIGCGWISEIAHMPSLATINRADVVAISDMQDDRRAVALRSFPGAKTFRDALDLIADPDVSAVVLALPPKLNRLVAETAFQAGKDVYIEKPLAPTKEDGESIVAAWRKSGQVGMIGYNFRRSPAVVVATEIIGSGALGQIVSVQNRFTWNAEGVSGWRTDPNSGGGALSDLASHHIDLLAHLLGSPISQVSAVLPTIRSPADTVNLSLKTKSDVHVQIHAGLASGRNTNILTLMGTKGHLNVDILNSKPPTLYSGGAPVGRVGKIKASLHELHLPSLFGSGREQSFQNAMDAFVDACLTRNAVQPDLNDGLAVLSVIEAARISAENAGQFVSLKDLKPLDNC